MAHWRCRARKASKYREASRRPHGTGEPAQRASHWTTQTVTDKQLETDDLKSKVAVLTKENNELKAQLAAGGNSEDTELLNSFGSILAKLIARLGLKT